MLWRVPAESKTSEPAAFAAAAPLYLATIVTVVLSTVSKVVSVIVGLA